MQESKISKLNLKQETEKQAISKEDLNIIFLGVGRYAFFFLILGVVLLEVHVKRMSPLKTSKFEVAFKLKFSLMSEKL